MAKRQDQKLSDAQANTHRLPRTISARTSLTFALAPALLPRLKHLLSPYEHCKLIGQAVKKQCAPNDAHCIGAVGVVVRWLRGAK